MTFGQLVVGPPGSGKSTYCRAVSLLSESLGRQIAVVNLDPANEFVPYDCAINVQDLVSVDNVMEEFGLGPNGALLYALDYLSKNLDWLIERLGRFRDHYIIFDCPGQAELFVHVSALRDIMVALSKSGFSLCAVNIVDSFQCFRASSYISAALLSLNTMLHLELPHINVMSKVDIMVRARSDDFPCDRQVFFDGFGLDHIFGALEAEVPQERFQRLNRELCGLLEDFSLVSFLPLDVSDARLMAYVVRSADQACGYIYSSQDSVQLAAPNEIELGRILDDLFSRDG